MKMVRRRFAFAAILLVAGAYQPQDVTDAGVANQLIASALEADDACQMRIADVSDAALTHAAEDNGCALKLLQLAVQRRIVGSDVDADMDYEIKIDGDGDGGAFPKNVLAQDAHNHSEAPARLQEQAAALRERLRSSVQDEVVTQEAFLASLDGEEGVREEASGPASDPDGDGELHRADAQRELQEEIEKEAHLEAEIEQEIEHEHELEDEFQRQHRHEIELENALHMQVPDPSKGHKELGHENFAHNESHGQHEDSHKHQEEVERDHEEVIEQELKSELGKELDANRFHELEQELGDVLAHEQLERDHEEEEAHEHSEYQKEERRGRELEDELVHAPDEQHRAAIRRELEDLLARERDDEAHGHRSELDHDHEAESAHELERELERKLAHEPDGPERDELEDELENVLAHAGEGRHALGRLARRLEDEIAGEHDERRRHELQRELGDVLKHKYKQERHEHELDENEDHDHDGLPARDEHHEHHELDHVQDDLHTHEGRDVHHVNDHAHHGHHEHHDWQELCLPQHLLNFSTSLVAHSNLGGAGPDDGDETLVYESVAFKDGMAVDLVISATTDYIAGDSAKNGIHNGVLGMINLRVDSRVDLLFRFTNRTGAPVEFGPFFFTFFDIDQGMAHSSRKSVTAHGLSDFKLARHTELMLEYFNDSAVRFQSSERGNREDNPRNPSSLTKEAAERTVTLVYPLVSEFSVSLEEANYADASHGRNFLFSGASSMVCGKEHTCTDYECPHGYHIRTMAEFLLCNGRQCTLLDRDTCCYREAIHASI